MDLIKKIESWGRLCPDRIAHITDGQELTYRELLYRSEKIAHYLAAHLPHSRSPVAILGHKQSDMLAGFIGCVKSGHPYIPLDSSLPEHRVNAIVAASEASLLTMDQLHTIISTTAKPSPSDLLALSPDDLWYIIFTSGSTGDPKGVMISRLCLEDFVDWILAEQKFKEAGETYLNQAPFSFDLSVMDLYSSLATGGTLFSITQDEIAEPRRLFASLGHSSVTVWVSTPSFARMCLMQPTFNQEMLPDVRKFWFCGETLAPEVAAELLRRFPLAEIWNTYGPTEATVATTSIKITSEVIASHNPLPVGRPKPGTRVLIQDEQSAFVPTGGRGEIVIAGPNVGLGYIHRPDLTSRAFLKLDGQRAYRTGDRGHFEGELLFFEGRIDFQIKLHGYRIEIGDIESHLRALDKVQDAVVIPSLRNGQPDYLVAFTILKDRRQETDFEITQELRRELAKRLPDYMVPRKFTFLTEFPATPNGKIDRQQLVRSIQ